MKPVPVATRATGSPGDHAGLDDGIDRCVPAPVSGAAHTGMATNKTMNKLVEQVSLRAAI